MSNRMYIRAMMLIATGALFISFAPTQADPQQTQETVDEGGAVAQGTLLQDIWNLLNSVSSRVNTAITRAQQARDRATEARDGVNEIRQKVQEGVAGITAQVQMMIGEAVEDLQRVIAEELEGREEFLGESGCSASLCEPFRQDMIMLLTNLETLMNCMFTLVEIEDLQVDFSREIEIVEVLPGRVLFPLYRVLAAESNLFGSGMIDRMNETADQLLVIKQILAPPAGAATARGGDAGLLLESELNSCAPILQFPGIAQNATRGVKGTAAGLKLVGKILASRGATSASGDAGIHGYVHVTLEDNKKKKWGEALVGLSEGLSSVGSAAGDKIDQCITLSTQNLLLQEIRAIKGRPGDFDGDGDIDLMDYGAFQLMFDGPVP